MEAVKKPLHMRGGGSLNPPTHDTVDKKMHYIYQDGKAVFKVAVKGMADVSYELMQKNNLKSGRHCLSCSSPGKYENHFCYSRENGLK